MESKTKHRILGMLVVAALIVILLPFLQTNRELPHEAINIKTPPFPDQPVQVSMTTQSTTPVVNEEIKQQPDDTIKAVHSEETSPAVPNIANPVIDKKPDAMKQQPNADSLKKPIENEVADNKTASAPTPPAEPLKKITVNNPPSMPVKSMLPKRMALNKHIQRKISYVNMPIDNNGLFKLHGAAWVIQVGSYRNKVSALRVVNHLRANGYRAFIQQISTALGSDTRVFVGPENKQSAARELAQKIENDMHLHGIVISYQPLAL